MADEVLTLGEALDSDIFSKPTSPIIMSSLVDTCVEGQNLFSNGVEDIEIKPDLWSERASFRCVLCCEPCSWWNIDAEVRMGYVFTLAELISDNPVDLGEDLVSFSFCDSCQVILSSLYRNILRVSKLEAQIKLLRSQVVSNISKNRSVVEGISLPGPDSIKIQSFLNCRKKLKECIAGSSHNGRKSVEYGHQKRLKVYTSRVSCVPKQELHEKGVEGEVNEASEARSSCDPFVLSYSHSEPNFGSQRSEAKTTLSRSKKESVRERFSCSHNGCMKTFAKEDAMLIHVKKVHEGIRNPFKCNLCDKSFKCGSRLKEHKEIHEEKKDFVCEQCGKTFSGKALLRNHKRCHNKVKREFQCKDCPKIYLTKQALQKHSIMVHTKNFPFYCEVCGIGFPSKNQWKCHVGHHSENDPLKCKDCGKTYGTPKDLRYHRQKHTGEYPIHCKICNKGMTTPTDLKRHMDVHNDTRDYNCDLCGKKFRRKQHLENHRKIHTNDRQHLCDVCGKGFYCSTTLRAHQRIHTGEQPYQCHICHKRFMHDHYIKKHLAYHEKAASEGRALKIKSNFHRKDTIAPGILNTASSKARSEVCSDQKNVINVGPSGHPFPST